MPTKFINGKSLYYTTDGPAESARDTLVLIHGLGSSSSYYRPVIPYLNSNIRCIAIDTPGSGLSSLGESEQTIDSIVEDIINLLDALDINTEITIVGHSMGGIVASAMAANHKSRVKGVVLIGPVNPSPAFSQVFDERIGRVKKDGLEALAESIPMVATGKSSTPLHHAFIRNLIIHTPTEGYISLCRVISTAQTPDYASITTPMLLIAGADDKTVPMKGCEEIFSQYATGKTSKTLKIIEGVGHWHCIEASEEVARLINDFVSEK